MDPAPLQLEENKRPKKMFLIVGGLVVAGLVAGAIFWLLTHSKKPASVPLAAPKVGLTLFAKGLPAPTAIVSTRQANDHRLFVADQSGIIRIVNKEGVVAPEPFLDIRAKVLSSGEMGLLGLAFSPNYSRDGNFFINYIDKAQNTIIARYHVSADAAKADAGSAQNVLTLKQPYQNHNGGDLAFGPDGYLYAALGDGGSGGDPQNRAQDLNSLFGKILRLDVSALPYKIPGGNPFAGQAGKRGEVWDYGLRNPWRISFDRKTHDLYIADVGQNKIEEINVEAVGKGGNNYGWRCFEGSPAYNPAGCGPRDKYVFPVLEYDHSGDRCSITGGYVYRGQKYPALAGKYFYGDYCSGDMYWAEKKAGTWQAEAVAKAAFKISTFGEDNDGEMYVADYEGGAIYRIEDSANPPQ